MVRREKSKREIEIGRGRERERERSERKIGNLPVVQDLGPAGLSFNI